MKILAVILGFAVWFAIDLFLARGLSKRSGQEYEAGLKRNIFFSLNMAAVIAVILAYMSF